MAIISQETFDKFTKEEKDALRREHNYLESLKEKDLNCDYRQFELERLVDRKNLIPKEIKIWEDIETEYQNCKTKTSEINHILFNAYDGSFDDKLIKKLVATYKIAKLIELGYGGAITEEEWKDKTIPKYCLVPNLITPTSYSIECQTLDVKRFIAFHTYQQANEFMSYPENRKLVDQYYMI